MKKLAILIFICGLMFTAFYSFTNNSGAGGGYTNAPSESNCTSCHSGTLNSGKFLNNLNLGSSFHGGGYLPDSTYTITISYSQPGLTKFGFSTTVLDKATSSPAGTLTSTGTRTQKRTRSYSGKTREYIEHTSSGTAQTSTNAISWTFDWTAPSSNIGDVVFYVVLNATNSNNSDNGDTIYAKQFTISPSTWLPTAKITASDSVICAGVPVTFFGGGTGTPTQYTWNFPNGNPTTSTSKNQAVTYSFGGTFNAILKVKNAYGDSKADTFKITVKTSPTAFINGNSTQYLCQGDSLLLTAQFGAGNTYLWSNGKSGQSIYVKDTGEYNVGVTATNGCTKVSPSVKLLYFNKPIAKISLSSNDTVCTGSQVTINVSGTYDTAYLLKNNNLINSGSTASFSITADSGALFAIKVKDSNKCYSDTSAKRLFVNQKLDAPVTSCINQTPSSVTFTWQNNPFYHNGVEISMDSGKTWIAPNAGNQHQITGLAQKTSVQAIVRAKDNAPCLFGKQSIQVCESGACNGLNVTAEYPQRVCFGQTAKVIIHGLLNQRFSLRVDGAPAISDTIFEFQPTISKAYVIEITDSNFISCPPEMVKLNITVDKKSNLNLRTQQSGNTFCEKDTVEVTATSGKDVYHFYVNNMLVQTSFDSFYYSSTFKDKDSAWVVVETGVCIDTSEKLILTIYPLPDAGFTWQRDTNEKTKLILDFRANTQGLSQYLFNFGDGKTSVLSVTSNDYSGKEGQTVTVSLKVKDFFGCENTFTKQVTIPFLNSVMTMHKDKITVYPVPVIDKLYLNNKADYQIKSIGIFTVQGIELLDIETDGSGYVDFTSLAKGYYMIKINTDKGTWQTRIIKQ